MKFDTQKAKEDTKANLHPEGKFEAVIIGAEAVKAKSGRDMIVLTWKTDLGPNEEGDIQPGGKLKSYHAYVDEYPGLFLNPMYAIGLNENYFQQDLEFEDIAMDCLKRKGLLLVVHGEYQGNPTASVEKVFTSEA